VGTGGGVLTDLTPARLDALQAGQLRIRQRPGPRNALGQVKFVFPNEANIYLHHTPSVGIFRERPTSHGCIRIERPGAGSLGAARAASWDLGHIRAAMTAKRRSTLKLDTPIPVLIAYATKSGQNGRIHFSMMSMGLTGNWTPPCAGPPPDDETTRAAPSCTTACAPPPSPCRC
jgi:hypothetical protein